MDWLFVQLANLDTTDSEYMESATLINEQIKKTMECVKLPKRLLEVDKSYWVKKHDFLFALSDDGQFGVFSWDSKIESTSGSIKNIALYASQKKVIPTSLYGEALHYNQIHTIKNQKGSPLYVLHGKGKSAESQNFYRLDAYTIKKDGLGDAKIFPNNASSLTSNTSTSNLGQELAMDFSIEMDGSLILKPELWGSTIVYRPLELNNHLQRLVYVEAGSKPEQSIVEGDFVPKNPHGFINGSELPLYKKEEEQKETFVFKNELKVEMVTDLIARSTTAKVSNNGTHIIEIPFGNPVVLHGKKDNLLFFSEKGKSTSRPIHIYDLSKNKPMLSKEVANVILMEDNLLFMESTEPYHIQNIDEIKCNPNYGTQKKYFKVYSFKYADPTPIVEYTHQLLCGSAERQNLASL